jgi:tetratricopeptide (TPR) repeat protein
VHPLLTESVTYIIQRTELLMALCLLLTLYCTQRGWRVGAVAACAAGMACKEVMVVAPVIVWLYDRIFLGGKQRASFYMALAGTWLVLAAILLTGPRSETVLWKHAGIDYLLTQAGVILHYLRLSVWPAPLVIDYDDWPMRANIPAVLAVVALLAATVWALRYRPKLGFLGAWFFLILAPTSSLVPIVTEVAAERRMYLPLIAVVALIAPVLRRWMVPVLVIGLMVLTWQRNQDYRSAQSIWRDAVAKRPGNVRALVNLAAVSSPAEAIGLQQRALAIDPDNAEAQYNLGVTLAGQKRLDEALPHLQRATELSPRSPVAHYNYGLALAQTGRFAEAEAALRRAVALEPHSADAHKQLGVALARQGRVADALPEFEEAARLEPSDEEARRYVESARQQR